ncbi:hypothetical protein AAFX24_28440 [Vibrio mediterranei]|uniref:hypothetical protein n=1 Tax=Vibrio mediterranei TaxID=689 RepID=UPI0038CE0346
MSDKRWLETLHEGVEMLSAIQLSDPEAFKHLPISLQVLVDYTISHGVVSWDIERMHSISESILPLQSDSKLCELISDMDELFDAKVYKELFGNTDSYQVSPNQLHEIVEVMSKSMKADGANVFSERVMSDITTSRYNADITRCVHNTNVLDDERREQAAESAESAQRMYSSMYEDKP